MLTGCLYDYQLSNVRQRFGDDVFGIKITVLLRATFHVSNGNSIVACNFPRFAADDVKDRLVANGTVPLGRDNNTSWTLKPVHQT